MYPLYNILLAIAAIGSFIYPDTSNATLAVLPLLAAGIAAGTKVIGDVAGRIASADDREKAAKIIEETYQKIKDLDLHPSEATPLLLEEFKQAGIYTPELEEAIIQSASEVVQMQERPEMRESQIQALNLLKDRSESGMTAEDRAAMNQIVDQASRETEAQEADIIRNLQQRGQAGSGAELAARLSAVQAGANRLSDQSTQQAAIAQQRALEAIKAQAGLSGDIRAQDYSTDITRAKAADELNRFNTQQQIARQQRNIGTQNIAQQQNLARQQSISDANIKMRNLEQERQRQAAARDWEKQLNLAKAQQSAAKDATDFYQGQAADTQKFGTGMGSAGADLAQSIFSGGSQPASAAPKYTLMSDNEQDPRKKRPFNILA